MVVAGLAVGMLVLSCLWGLGAFQLTLLDHPNNFGGNWPALLFWVPLSLLVFVLATGGITVLVMYGVDRGRPAIWITLAAAVVLIVLITWGYVAVTQAAMAPYDSGPPEYPQPTTR